MGDNTDQSSSRSSIIPRIPSRIDLFGFLLTPKQFLIILLLAACMLGRDGFSLFLFMFAAYRLYVFVSGSRASNNNFGGSGRTFGANIQGVKDLPKPPPSWDHVC